MSTFDHIVLNGRPGGGKSEFIDFLRRVPREERRARYHIADFEELDDFPWLWDKFVEDDLWEALGEPRRFSKKVPGGYVQFEGDKLLDMLMMKMDRIVERDYLSNPSWYEDNTLILEFSRGTVDGGYKRAYELFSKALWERAVICYISVSFEESRRRNEARYQEALAHSILAHKLPEESLQRFSAEQDFHVLTDHKESGYLEIKGIQVPFVSIHNEPELKDPDALSERYGQALKTLAKLWEERP